MATETVKNRSSSYPYYTIEKSFEFVKKMYGTFGSSSFHTREEIAEVFKMSVGNLTIPISTAVQYGLIELKMKVGYKPSSLFIKYYKPESDEEKRLAKLDCLAHPKLYKALVEQYSNNIVPTVDAIATTLFRKYNIAENASKKAAQTFVDNLKLLNLISEDNMLRQLSETPENIEEVDVLEPESDDKVDRIPHQQFKQIGSQVIDSYQLTEDLSMAIKLQNGRRAKLIYPEGITDSEWDKIIRVIGAMKDDDI